MNATSINHEAWTSVFQGLSQLPSREIALVLGLPNMTSARLRFEAMDYVMEKKRLAAEQALLSEGDTDDVR